MINKPFTGKTIGKKQAAMLAASTALAITLVAPAAFAAEPGIDTPIDDSMEEIVPEEPEAPVEAPAEPVDEDTPIAETPETPAEEPAPETPAPTPEPETPAPVEEEPEVDTGTEPPIAVIPPETTAPVVETPAPSPEPVVEADTTIRVIVNYRDEDGVMIHAPVQLRGAIGEDYFAENLDIPGYEVTGVEGETSGVMRDGVVTVTYTYMSLAAAPTTPAPAEPTEPGEDTPIDDSDEVLVPAPGEDAPAEGDEGSDATPTPAPTPTAPGSDAPADGDAPVDSDTPIDDSNEVIVPVTPGAEDESGTDEKEEAIDDSREEIVKDDAKKDKDARDKGEVVASTSDQDGKGGDLKAIPQAGAETNWLMVGLGAVVTGAAAIWLFARRKVSGFMN